MPTVTIVLEDRRLQTPVSTMQSLIRVTWALVCVLVVLGAGVWANSSAMQWMGFLALLVVFVMAVFTKVSKRYTPQEAADHLYQAYGVSAPRRERRL